jgi:hypothetical protein
LYLLIAADLLVASNSGSTAIANFGEFRISILTIPAIIIIQQQ